MLHSPKENAQMLRQKLACVVLVGFSGPSIGTPEYGPLHLPVQVAEAADVTDVARIQSK